MQGYSGMLCILYDRVLTGIDGCRVIPGCCVYDRVLTGIDWATRFSVCTGPSCIRELLSSARLLYVYIARAWSSSYEEIPIFAILFTVHKKSDRIIIGCHTHTHDDPYASASSSGAFRRLRATFDRDKSFYLQRISKSI